MEHIELLVLENQKLKDEIKELQHQLKDEKNFAINRLEDVEIHYHNEFCQRKITDRLCALHNVPHDKLKEVTKIVKEQNPFKLSGHLQHLKDERNNKYQKEKVAN